MPWKPPLPGRLNLACLFAVVGCGPVWLEWIPEPEVTRGIHTGRIVAILDRLLTCTACEHHNQAEDACFHQWRRATTERFRSVSKLSNGLPTIA